MYRRSYRGAGSGEGRSEREIRKQKKQPVLGERKTRLHPALDGRRLEDRTFLKCISSGLDVQCFFSRQPPSRWLFSRAVLRFSTSPRFIPRASSLNRLPVEIYGQAIMRETRINSRHVALLTRRLSTYSYAHVYT